jgi:glycerol-3-phosphate dehydrogenase
MEPDYDLCIIGGGINGAGIARDAAGRGLSVLLVEAQDLAQGTSSASTKLVHGGLRYLEQYNFKLVKESLKEREVLMRIAPHLVQPQEFIMPHVEGFRSKFLVGMGLWFYDHLGGRRSLPSSGGVSFKDSFIGQPLRGEYKEGFRYSDCSTDDARLVVLNALDAKLRGADVLTRTACMGISQVPDLPYWYINLKDLRNGDEFQMSARMIVNASGPWVRGILEASNLVEKKTPGLRLVKGSHMVIPRLYEGDHAYLLQQPDGRVVFTIPYQEKFTLVGTTDEPFEGDPSTPSISRFESEYLCDAVNRFFTTTIKPSNAIWTFSGVRSLVDDGATSAQKISRDFKLYFDNTHGAPIISVFGGKLTTYRYLSQQVVSKVVETLGRKRKLRRWTARTCLPGGNIGNKGFARFLDTKIKEYAFLPPEVVTRYVRAYGSRIDVLLDGITTLRGMGRDFGGGLYEKEIFYLINHEFAQSVEDIIWRRTKLGLHLEKKTILALETAMPDYLKATGMAA